MDDTRREESTCLRTRNPPAEKAKQEKIGASRERLRVPFRPLLHLQVERKCGRAVGPAGPGPAAPSAVRHRGAVFKKQKADLEQGLEGGIDVE